MINFVIPFGITRLDSEGRISNFLSHPHTNNGLFFLLTIKCHICVLKKAAGSRCNMMWWCHCNIIMMSLAVFPRECVSCVFDAINWLLTHWQFVCVFFVTHTKTAARTNSIFFMCRDLRTSIYLDDNASINSVPVENRPAHNYLCWVFPWCI